MSSLRLRLRRERIAGSASDYDERGNEVEWACFGVDGRPCANKDGYHRNTYRYDEQGNPVEWACFGVDDRTPPPLTISMTYSSCRCDMGTVPENSVSRRAGAGRFGP